MQKGKVAILMSTFNGEQYLESQIRSILNQTYKNWQLYIRDDGSTDNTVNIIKKYCSLDNRIIFLNKDSRNNVGVVHSFMDLLKNIEADYYMFSDQDDFWLKNKISDTLKVMLSSDSNNIPICVHTNYSTVDSKLHLKNNNVNRKTFSKFEELLFCNCIVGCTMMINNKLRQLINFGDFNYSQIYMHDWWMGLIASEFGKVLYLKKSTMLYRQHNNNVVGDVANRYKFILSRLINPTYDKKEILKIINVANAFYKEFASKMSNRSLIYVRAYGSLLHNSSFMHNLLLVFKLPPCKRLLIQKLYFDYDLVVYNNYYREQVLEEQK